MNINKLTNLFPTISNESSEAQLPTEPAPISSGIADTLDAFETFQPSTIDLNIPATSLTTLNADGTDSTIAQQATVEASDLFQIVAAETEPPLAAAGAERPMLSPEEIAVDQMQNIFKKQFQEFASDPEKFHATMKFIYGLEYDSPNNERWPLPASYSPEIAESLRQRALAGDYSWLPKIEFNEYMANGQKGWFLETPPPTVYLSEKLLNDPTEATRCFIKAVGYHLDNLTNDPDYDVDKEKEKYLGKDYSRAFWPVYPEELNEARGNEGEKFRATLAHEFPREDIFHQEYRDVKKDSKNRVVQSFILL